MEKEWLASTYLFRQPSCLLKSPMGRSRDVKIGVGRN